MGATKLTAGWCAAAPRPHETTGLPPAIGPPIGDRLLNTRETAAYLGLGVSTVHKWRSIKSNGPPFLKLGRRVLYRRADLDAWLDTRLHRSTADQGVEAA